MSGSKLSTGTNRLALVRPTRVSSLQAVSTERSSKQERSASTPKQSSAVSLAKPSASAMSSDTVGSGIQRMNSLPNLRKLCQQSKDGSAIKGSLFPKPKSRVLSVLPSQMKGPVKAGGKHMLYVACLLLTWLLNVPLIACCSFHHTPIYLLVETGILIERYP